MRVLHLDEQRGWRGGEQQLHYLVQGLAKHGVQQWVAGRPGGELIAKMAGRAGVIPVALPFRSEVDLFTALALARLVRRECIDLLHAHTAHAHTMALLARRLAGRGQVIVSRRVDFPPKTDPLNRWKYRAPERIIAISEAIAQVLRRAGIDEARLRVVPSGIDPARMAVERIARTALGLPSEAWVIGCVAALVGHKDHATLLRAFQVVATQRADAHLLLAGDGPLREELAAQADALDIAPRVHFLGYRRDVPALLGALDVFVLPSREEGLGTSVLDAMAAGVPVVATAAGGIPEMVRPENTGLLVPIGDHAALGAALLRMGGDAALRTRCSDGARRLLHERFTALAMVAGNLAVYRELF